jgi:hypothetical protein
VLGQQSGDSISRFFAFERGAPSPAALLALSYCLVDLTADELALFARQRT